MKKMAEIVDGQNSGDPDYQNMAPHFDNIAFKAGNNSLVEHNTFGTGHGASIGSLGEKETWMKNITIKKNTFQGTTNGFRIKTVSGAAKGK